MAFYIPITIVLNRNRPCMIQLIPLNTVIQFYQWPWSIQDNAVPTGSLLFPIDRKLYHLWLILNPFTNNQLHIWDNFVSIEKETFKQSTLTKFIIQWRYPDHTNPRLITILMTVLCMNSVYRPTSSSVLLTLWHRT